MEAFKSNNSHETQLASLIEALPSGLDTIYIYPGKNGGPPAMRSYLDKYEAKSKEGDLEAFYKTKLLNRALKGDINVVSLANELIKDGLEIDVAVFKSACLKVNETFGGDRDEIIKIRIAAAEADTKNNRGRLSRIFGLFRPR